MLRCRGRVVMVSEADVGVSGMLVQVVAGYGKKLSIGPGRKRLGWAWSWRHD